MQKQESADISGRIFHIMSVDLNQFASVETVFPADAKKRFQRFLLTVGDMQKSFVGSNAPIQVDSLETVEIMRQFMS